MYGRSDTRVSMIIVRLLGSFWTPLGPQNLDPENIAFNKHMGLEIHNNKQSRTTHNKHQTA